MNKQTQWKNTSVKLFTKQKCAMYTDVKPFEHVAYNIVYLGLRVVSNDMTHIKGTLV